MKRFLSRWLFATLSIGFSAFAFAGQQQYEPLADSVRVALRSAVRDATPPVLQFSEIEHARRWLNTMHERLRVRIPDHARRTELLKAVHYYATRTGLDPQLVLAVIQIESGFQPQAVSSAGARGLMQVIPFWVKLLGEGTNHNLFDLQTNVLYGCVILRHYLDLEHGDYFRALGRYNGSLGQAEYPERVHAAWKGRWAYDGPTH